LGLNAPTASFLVMNQLQDVAMENKVKEYIIFISVNDRKILLLSVDLLLIFSQTLHLLRYFVNSPKKINNKSLTFLLFQKVKSSILCLTKKTVVI
jgi:hypothetical protein